MAQLTCGVANCCYNADKKCCKGDIMVGGSHAERQEDTCCESFRQEGCECYTSALDHPCRTISIDCEATKCRYNSNYKCYADSVSIKGCGAKDCGETVCATFSEK